MSRLTRSTAAVALAAVTMTIAAACTPADGVGITPTPAPTGPVSTTSSPTPTTTPTPTPTSSEEMENNAAEQGVVNFWATLDKLSSHPDQSLEKLVRVSRGESASTWRQVITYMRKQEYTQVGASVLKSVSATKNKTGKWNATACIDVGKINVVDKKGKSVVKAGRPPRVEYRYVLERDGDTFYVINDKAVGEC